MNATSSKQVGHCFCGAVEVEVTGAPEGMGYCHCESCRSWSAGPVNAFTLWKPENVRVTRGAELIGHFEKTEKSDRQFCVQCGGHLMTRHPTFGLIDVYAATIPGLAFSPGVHVNYAESVLRMKDGLPKFKDFPAELGGSGDTVPE
ncbi:MAG: GFA family protein [Tahibacter sp.]